MYLHLDFNIYSTFVRKKKSLKQTKKLIDFFITKNFIFRQNV